MTGPVTNEGTVNTTNAKVTWNGYFYNSSAYTSQGSTQTFNSTLEVNGSGYLVGGSQDVFVFKEAFLNAKHQRQPMEHGPVHPAIRHGHG